MVANLKLAIMMLLPQIPLAVATFFIVKEPKLSKLYVCKGSHQYEFYLMEDMTKQGTVLKLESVYRSPFPILIEQRNLRHSEAEYIAYRNMHYHHLYLIQATLPTLDAICNS